MTILSDAWKSLRAVANLVDRIERQTDDIKTLSAEMRGVRERLVVVETIIAFARGQVPRLPR